VTEEEIKSLVAQGANSGDVEEVEHDIIQRVFNLGDRKVGSLMTNRIDMEWIDLADDYQTNYEKIINSHFNALPVCEDGIDNVLGILQTRTFFKHIGQNLSGHPLPDFKAIIIKAHVIPENMTGFNLLEKFKEWQTKIAIVVDEFGAVQGIVTMTDLVNALVGEMDNPVTEEDHEILEREDGTFLVDALVSFDEFVSFFELDDEVDDEDRSGFHTLGGFILHLTEEIPKTGEILVWKHFSFEILDMDGNRIDKILVKNHPDAPELGD
jgi:putative hemolysin